MRDDLHEPARPGPGGTVGDQVTGAWSDARSVHPSPELRFSNADPCSSSGGPDRRGSSAGAVGDVRLRARSTPPAIAGYLVRQSGPNTLSKPQDRSGAATSGAWTVGASR